MRVRLPTTPPTMDPTFGFDVADVVPVGFVGVA